MTIAIQNPIYLSFLTHDTDTKGGLGNTIAFVSITLSNKPVFLQVDEGVKYEGSTSRARAQGGCMVILYPPVLTFFNKIHYFGKRSLV